MTQLMHSINKQIDRYHLKKFAYFLNGRPGKCCGESIVRPIARGKYRAARE